MNLTVRAEELGDELKRLRERTGMSLEVVGELINAGANKISRIENGLREGSPEDISALLAAYRCTGSHRTKLMAIAHEVERRGWWQRHKNGYTERVRTLVNQERKAKLIVYVETMNIPGLLQTGEYGRAQMHECGLVPEAEVEQRMVVRMQRQSILYGPEPPRLLTIIDESVLHYMVGGPDVMRRQLDYLVEASKEPNITVRVVPKLGAHAALDGAFRLFRRENDHRVVHIEGMTCSLYLEEADEIERYEQAIRLLLRRALSEEESVRLIAKLARTLDPEATQDDLAEE